MHRWKEDIEEIKNRLQELTMQLEPLLNLDQKSAMETQLKTVEQTINKLSKSAVEIPAELRDLKFRLLRDLDQFKEAEQAKKELDKELSQFLNPQYPEKELRTVKPEIAVKKKIRVSSMVKLRDLVEANILKPNTKLYRKYKNVVYDARITDKGQMEISLNGRNHFFDSPSAAAKFIAQVALNGWVWWYVEEDKLPLDYYRKKYLENETEK